jgi:Protein of unknown function (DUF4231)
LFDKAIRKITTELDEVYFSFWQVEIMQSRRYQHFRDDLPTSLPSLRYQQKSDNLWQLYHEGKIDHSRYLELLDALKAEEIESEAKRYPIIGNTPERRERIENVIWNYEYISQEVREEEARKKSLSPLEAYKEEIPNTITRYRKDSNGYRRTANIFQMVIIVGSVLATSATSAVGFGFGDIFKWIAPAISISVAIAAGFTGYFKFRERSFNLQQTADTIEQEYVAVGLGIGYYKGKLPQESCLSK